MNRTPLYKNDTFWGDVNNLLNLRNVYRKSKDMETVIASAEDPKGTVNEDLPPVAEPTSTEIPSADFPSAHPTRDAAKQTVLLWIASVVEFIKTFWLFILGGIGFISIVWIIWFFFIATNTHNMTIERFSWERKIEVIQYKVLHDSGWSRPPRDAYNVDRDYRYHYSERYVSGYHTESYSCGSYDRPKTCTRQVEEYSWRDVYDWHYDYNYNRWRHSRWIVSGAADQSTPFWADLTNEHFDSTDVIGNEQLSGNRAETYTVYFVDNTDNNRAHSEMVDLSLWSKLSVGQKITGQVTRSHVVKDIDWGIS